MPNFEEIVILNRYTKLVFLLFLIRVVAYGQNSSIDSFINNSIKESHTPGLAACLINNGKVKWVGYYGYQNVDKEKHVDSQTIFMLASVSKTITAAALMKLYSQKKFKLDDDINLQD